MRGNSFLKSCIVMRWPWAMLSLMYVYTCGMVVVWEGGVSVMCCGCVRGGWLCNRRRMVRHLGSRLLDICWLHMLGLGL